MILLAIPVQRGACFQTGEAIAWNKEGNLSYQWGIATSIVFQLTLKRDTYIGHR